MAFLKVLPAEFMGENGKLPSYFLLFLRADTLFTGTVGPLYYHRGALNDLLTLLVISIPQRAPKTTKCLLLMFADSK